MKLVVFVIIFLMGSFTGRTQIYIGPEIGMNIIQVDRLENGRAFQPGWYGAGVFEYRFNDWFGIKTGINYCQRRQGYTVYDTSAFSLFGLSLDSLGLSGFDSNTYTTTSGRISQSHFEIPVQARFNYKEYYIGIGGFVSFMIHMKDRQLAISETPMLQTIDVAGLLDSAGLGPLAFFLPEAYEEEYTLSESRSDYKWFDYGFKGTVGYQSDHFGFSASYQYGLPDFRKLQEGSKKNHHFLQFSINYLFAVNKSSGGGRLN